MSAEYAVPVDEAMGRLAVIPDYDPGDGPKPCVHTFAQGGMGMLLGAHWSLDSVRAFIEKHGVEESGSQATAMGHGLVAIGDGRSLGITAAMQDALGHPDESLIRTLELKDRVEDGVREAIL